MTLRKDPLRTITYTNTHKPRHNSRIVSRRRCTYSSQYLLPCIIFLPEQLERAYYDSR